MVKSPLWLRVAAPCLALGLGGCFVWMKQEASEQQAAKTQKLSTPAASGKRTVLPGSKNPARLMEPKSTEGEQPVLPAPKAEDARPSPEEKPGTPRVLPGSKIGIIELDDIKDTKVFGSSKSGAIFEPEDLKQRSVEVQGNGNGAINRNNIDEVLNNPNRAQPPAQKEEPKPEQQQQPAKPAEP